MHCVETLEPVHICIGAFQQSGCQCPVNTHTHTHCPPHLEKPAQGHAGHGLRVELEQARHQQCPVDASQEAAHVAVHSTALGPELDGAQGGAEGILVSTRLDTPHNKQPAAGEQGVQPLTAVLQPFQKECQGAGKEGSLSLRTCSRKDAIFVCIKLHHPAP